MTGLGSSAVGMSMDRSWQEPPDRNLPRYCKLSVTGKGRSVHARVPGCDPRLRDITSAERSSQISFAAFCPQSPRRAAHIRNQRIHPAAHARTYTHHHSSSHGSSVRKYPVSSCTPSVSD